MLLRPRRPPSLWFALLAFASLPWLDGARDAAAEEPGAAEPAARYPFDPVCPWGRVADGRGILVRCLEASEAARLSAARPPAPAAAPAAGVPAASSPAAAPPL